MAILLALNQMMLLLAGTIAVNRFFFAMMAGILIGVAVQEKGTGLGALFFLASCLLAWILVANKAILPAYIGVFGLYAILKHLIEGQQNLKKEIILKFLLFSVMTAAYYFALPLLFPAENVRLLSAAFLFVLQIVYDIVFTHAITYYRKHIAPRWKGIR